MGVTAGILNSAGIQVDPNIAEIALEKTKYAQQESDVIFCRSKAECEPWMHHC